MKIGKPKRVYRVEPLQDPVPSEPKRVKPHPRRPAKEPTVAPLR
jgi:hypothetical protein